VVHGATEPAGRQDHRRNNELREGGNYSAPEGSLVRTGSWRDAVKRADLQIHQCCVGCFQG
jgi:hypothetical protein